LTATVGTLRAGPTAGKGDPARHHPDPDPKKEAPLPDAPPPQAVLFDFGHTLVDFRRVPEALVAAYAKIRQVLEAHVSHDLPAAEELGRQVTGAVDAIVRRSYEEGRIAELDVVELLVDAFAGIGIPVGTELAGRLAVIDHEAFSHSISVAPATIAALQAIAERGLAMGLVSNITLLPALLHADLDTLGLGRFLTAVAFSSEVGWRKPDPRIFAYVLERLGADPAATVFVGDRLYDDVGGASAAGMRTVLTTEFRDELAGPERAEARRIGEEALAALRPDAVIAAIGELPAVLRKWGA
jgi:FMN phosphatase YigB (HAD superfamily)